MKSKEITLDMITLKKRGLSDRRIAKRLGIDRRTVKK
jgi:DNA-binding CsgD family transcriptional regulator